MSNTESKAEQTPHVLSKQEIYTLLHNRTKQWDFPTLSSLPHPYTLKSCKEASEFLAEKIRPHLTAQNSPHIQNTPADTAKPCKILVVGDYDVDGVIASVVMMKFFAQLGYGDVEYVIPSRFVDGYGISSAIIKQHPSDVIITVDNGITAYEAAEYCAAQGIPLIITDHHIPKDTLPNAPFIINPQQRDCTFVQKEICGALVAWYFCAGLKVALGAEISLTPLLELVMLATIADMMPLTQINKCVVLYGLKQFDRSQIPALRKLKSRLKTRYVTATDISFSLTPLINAAGRMGEGRIASEFLLLDCNSLESNMHAKAFESKPASQPESPESTHTLEHALDSGLQALLMLNQTRKDTAKAVLESAHASAIVYEHAIIARGDDWHEGVLGIVAAQLASAYERPAFVLSTSLKNPADVHAPNHSQNLVQTCLKGSARSWNDIDIMEILLGASEILGEFGGHSKAAGLSVKSELFEAFCAYLSQLQDPPKCKSRSGSATGDSGQCGCGDEGEALGEMAVLPIDSRDIDEELFALLDKFEPYGQGNPKPIFTSILRIKKIQPIKSHKKFSFFNTPIQGMWFFAKEGCMQGEWARVQFNMQMDSFSHRPIMIIQSIEPMLARETM